VLRSSLLSPVQSELIDVLLLGCRVVPAGGSSLAGQWRRRAILA
jgi:hypothetical protein